MNIKFRVYFRRWDWIKYKDFFDEQQFEDYIEKNDWFYFTKIEYDNNKKYETKYKI